MATNQDGSTACRADKTERSERGTRQGQTQFQGVLENILDGFLALDRDFRCTYVNKAAAAFLGTTPDEMVGHVIWEAFPPARYPPLHAEITRAAEQQVHVKFQEYCQKCGHWFEWHCYPTDDRLAIFVEDISERKQAEEQIARSEQHYRLLFETMPQGVVYQDTDGKIISMNPAAERILGRTPAEFLGRTSVGEEYHTRREDGSPFPASEHPSMVALRTGQEVHNVVMGVFNPRERAYRWINITAVPLVRPGEHKPYQVYTHFADITELRQALRALQYSERRFRKLFEADLIGIFITKADGTFLDCNEALARMLGYDTREEVLQHRSSDFYVDPEFRAEAVHLLQTKGIYLGREGRVWRKDGSIAHLLGAAVLLTDEETGKPYIQGVAVDITERRRAEEALRASEERYRKLFEANMAGVYVAKLDGTILDFNEAMMKMLGYDSREEVFHHRVPDFYVDPEVRLELIRLLKRDGIVQSKEVLLRKRDGSPLYALGSAALLTDEYTGEPYILGVALDMTARKKGEERLAQNLRDVEFLSLSATGYLKAMPSRELFEHTTQELQSVAGQAVVVVSEYDPGTNQTIVRGVAGPEDKRRKLSVLLGRDPVGLAFTGAPGTLERATPGRLEFVKGGLYELTFHQMPLPLAASIEQELGVREIYAMPFSLGEDFMGTVAVGTDRVEGLQHRELMEAIVSHAALALKRTRTEEALRDLTATLEDQVAQRTVELEDRAQQLQKLALELSETEDRERERLAEILHGDLQQTLAAAKFHLGLVRHRSEADPPMRQMIEQINKLLIEAIGTSRSLSHELSPLGLAQRDMGETFEWLAQQIQAKHGLTVHLDVRDRIEPASEPIRGMLYRAAREMLFNVVKHAGVREATLRLRRRGGSICLSVSDKGRGFDPEEPGRTAGSGLRSIQERVGLLGGRMKVRSRKGKGSTFLVIVPGTPPPPAAQAEAPLTEEVVRVREVTTPRERAAGAEKRVLRVLLADDHKIVREGIESILEGESDIEIVGQAGDGRETVDLANQLEPDVVVMDVSMPTLSGDEATRRIKRSLPQTRVVALSMHDEAWVKRRMSRAGAAAYLLKTAPSEELVAAIRGQEPDAEPAASST